MSITADRRKINNKHDGRSLVMVVVSKTRGLSAAVMVSVGTFGPASHRQINLVSAIRSRAPTLPWSDTYDKFGVDQGYRPFE